MAELRRLEREVVEVASDTETMFANFMKYLPNPDLLLESTGETQEIYEKMLLDGHITAMLSLRKAFTLGKPHTVVPVEKGERAEQIAEYVDGVLEDLHIQQDLEELLGALEHGYAVTELVWERRGTRWIPKDLKSRDQKRFLFSPKGELLLDRGIKKPLKLEEKYKFIVHRNEIRHENPYGTSLLSRCYWPWMMKKAGLKFWVIMCEKFGVPTVLALFEEGDEDEAQKRARTIARALQNIQSDAAVALANVDNVMALEARGHGDAFEKLLSFCNQEISKAITSQVLSSDIGGRGSYALAKTHLESLNKISLNDTLALQRVLNEILIDWIVDLNFGPEAPRPRFEFDLSELPSWEEILDAIERGIPVSKRAIYAQYNIPEPEDEEDRFISPLVQARTGGLAMSEGMRDFFFGLPRRTFHRNRETNSEKA